MNSKQVKSLRRAIKERYPNSEPSFIKQVIKNSKKDFGELSILEKDKLAKGDNNGIL
jgi:hypothetical protein